MADLAKIFKDLLGIMLEEQLGYVRVSQAAWPGHRRHSGFKWAANGESLSAKEDYHPLDVHLGLRG